MSTGWARAAVLGLVSAGLSFSLVSVSGCTTDAVAVPECRDIEDARCEAGLQCGFVDDVAACKRFYREHCLHGLSVEDAPRASAVKDCTATIRAAGACKASNTSLADCDLESTRSPKIIDVCDVVELPEETGSCGFLVGVEPEEIGAGGSAGAGGTGGAGASGGASSGGTGGAAGSGGAGGATQ